MHNDIAVICDFDGTVSVKDVNLSIFQTFGNEKTDEIERKYRNSEIGIKESLLAQYKIIRIDDKTFKRYVYEKMDIDETFFELSDYLKLNGIELAIVSGGFINYMKILFDKHNRPLNIPVYTNELVVQDGILIPHYGDVSECAKHYGPCGVCKYQHIVEYKKRYNVIYVGDGYTDRCAAESADIVFAKDNLYKYCIENNIKCFKYDSFKDVKRYIEALKEKQI